MPSPISARFKKGGTNISISQEIDVVIHPVRLNFILEINESGTLFIRHLLTFHFPVGDCASVPASF